MFNFHRKPDLESQIYNELCNILYLYKNEDVYFTAEMAAHSIYKIIKNYIFLCVTGECNAKFTDNQEKIFFESLLK